ncbi:putative pectinesterase/pectinesterase inhibitor 44 [Abeliophyllum distichum]|uniref:Pectinesterase n=1 Tax=Abeliophyllum distichum TaxID=126358 RepID=A0ABD1VZ22_9LAMI
MFCLLSPLVTGDLQFVDQSELLNVPMSHFLGSVRSTMDTVRQVISMMSNFTGKFDDFRLSSALSDCLDLMDLSADELSWILSASQNSDGKENNSPENVRGDMRAWLSGVLINKDTCLEGFDGTNTTIESFVGNSLNRITTLTHDILSMIPTTWDTMSEGGTVGGGGGGGGVSGGRKVRTNDKFPHWLKSNDRKLFQAANDTVVDVVVTADGTGNFTSIMDAISAAPEYSKRRYVIYVKCGVYKEYVEISKKKLNIMMIGDGMDVTIISGNRSYADGWTPYRSATFAVTGKGFIARDMTFENTAGPFKYQAVAFRSDSEFSVVYRCAIRGYQDTLYSHSLRQFYKECHITGTVDFIFGRGTAVFQNCQILVREGLPKQKNTITAHGREKTDSSGFSIQFCYISVESNVTNPTYLGRPWKKHSRTIIMESYISDAIRPEGWLEWNGSWYLDTLYYAEYMNYGPGAGLGGRVKWPGYHIINDSAQVKNFTVAKFISGNKWLPSTGVKYTAGLTI